MKVAWFDAKEIQEESIETSHDIDFFYSSLSLSSLDSSYDVLSVCPSSAVTEEVMRKVMPDKIVCRSSGYDNVDIDAANKLGIPVQNARGYGSESVAEFNVSMILAAAKNLDRDIGLNPSEQKGSTGRELRGSKLGVIGAGDIGKEVLSIARGLGMDLYAYDPYKDEETAEKIGFEYISLEKLLKISDVVSVNCPLNESTRGLLSNKEFELMADVILVNTARGEIIDTKALEEALEEGDVSKAALDVGSDEGFQCLKDRSDVFFTPHNAYNTAESKQKRLEITMKNISSKINVVNSP